MHTYRFVWSLDKESNPKAVYWSDILASNRKEAGKQWKEVKAMLPVVRRRVHLLYVISNPAN